ncbi:MAG: cupin domain-containing protein [Primorskyibacter sp.]
MKINADFTQRVVVRFDQTDWVASPMAGVARKMLDRIGTEVARATTIVRFDPGSRFSAHTHDGGEEYLVLDGTFQDESGDYGPGSYVRNPPTSHHTPAATEGATILVKLHQFDPDDRTEVVIDTTAADWLADGRLALFEDAQEYVRLERWAAGETVDLDATGGLELFVITGDVTQTDDTLRRWDWLRLPQGGTHSATAGANGAQVWIKSGHLAAETKRGAL